MYRRLILPALALGVLLVLLVLLQKAHKELNRYASLKDRHVLVMSGYQRLARQVNNAAVIHPSLIMKEGEHSKDSPFFIDSTQLSRELHELQANVRDTVNVRLVKLIAEKLNAEISWLLASDVPDSIAQGKAPEHVASFRQIDSLIAAGIRRTDFLIGYRKKQLDNEIRTLKEILVFFILLSIASTCYMLVRLFKQKRYSKKKELELETTFNRVKDGVVSLDKNWRYNFLNDAALVTHPGGKKNTIGKLLWEVHPEIRETIFWEKYQEAMKTGQVLDLESFYPPLNAWFAVKVYPSDNGLTIFFTDITVSKQMDIELALSVKELNDYKQALDESCIVAITDQRGTITHVNNNFCSISGYDEKELIGQDHRIINSGYHTSDFIKNLWATIAKGKVWKGELKNKARNGTYYWVDTTIVPFLDSKTGKPYQYVSIRSDITERKLTEEKLTRSEKIYKTIASSIPDSVICILDTDLRYLLIEGDMLEALGFKKSDLLGKKMETVLPAERYQAFLSHVKQLLQGNIITTESTLNGYDIISRYVPLKDDEHNVYAIMTVTIDITPLKNAQRNISNLNQGLEKKVAERTLALKKMNEEMEAFSYSVSHDLRAPLRSIIGFSSMLEEDYADSLNSGAKRITGIIKGSALRMGKLIDDLLTFSRTGKQDLRKACIDTNAMVNEIKNEVLENEAYHNVVWKIDDLPKVFADLNTIRQVWVNLVANAAKYSSKSPSPTIEIGSKKQDGQVVFYVKDNGVGFDETYKDKLFKVFQRLHDSSDFEGTGVGLALVDKIIKKHGGAIWAEGREGHGATFYFSLPDN